MLRVNKIFLLALTSAFIVNCGSDDQQQNLRGEVVTSSFLEDFTGTFAEENGDESIQFFEDGTILYNKVRQVGSEDSQTVPYETVCTYTQKGKITAVYKLFDQFRTYTNPENGETYLHPETHSIEYSVSSIEWNRDADASNPKSANCANFEKETNSNPGSYSIGTEILGEDQLRFHTSGGGDFVGQEVKTPSILDEIFNRQ